MRFKELKEMDNAGLDAKLAELRKELMHDYTQVSSGAPPKSPGLIRQRRRNIARILTLLNERREVKGRK